MCLKICITCILMHFSLKHINLCSVCSQFLFIITWFYYNQISVTFRLRSRLSSSYHIAVLNTPLYFRKVTYVKQHNCKYYCIPFIYFFGICVLTHTQSHIYIYIYTSKMQHNHIKNLSKRLKIKPNRVKIRSLSWQFFVLPSTGF
jgi:hypothetical protein